MYSQIESLDGEKIEPYLYCVKMKRDIIFPSIVMKRINILLCSQNVYIKMEINGEICQVLCHGWRRRWQRHDRISRVEKLNLEEKVFWQQNSARETLKFFPTTENKLLMTRQLS